MDDSQEFPETAKVRLSRGKLFEESKAHIVYDAIRIEDSEKQRYYYNLLENGILVHERVNPLFLDFV
jgi:hypothetical protein